VSRTLSRSEIAVHCQAACMIEVCAPKPGNVSPGRDFADTRLEDFLLSAAAIGPAFAEAGAMGVGGTVLRGVQDTRRLVGVNTNLGMVLLLAPLACAAAAGSGPLRARLATVLAGLGVDDARAVHHAIRLASPGGLGRVTTQDVRDEPTLGLRETMALAADRDTIAREYVTDYDVTFGVTVPAMREARARGLAWTAAVVDAYLHTLGRVPDTLIARKLGSEAARAVCRRASEVLAAGAPGSPERARGEAELDAELRGPRNRLNPGTTADVVTAALFVLLCEGP
jgi:triphosphoribosyl-dephospho-CoA synthase